MVMANWMELIFISVHLVTMEIFRWSETGAAPALVVSARFTPATGTWRLDTNGDGILNSEVDTCVTSFGKAGDFPVTREMGGVNGTIIGTYTPETIVKINGRNKVKWSMEA